MRLYELANQYEFLLKASFNEETGEIDKETMDKLNSLSEPIETKCINITKLFKEIEAERKAISEEIKSMSLREKTLKTKVESLKGYLLENMERCKIFEIKCPQFVIKIQKNPYSVDIYDKEKIPEKYKKVKIDFDLQGIKSDLNAAESDIPGARLVQKNSIRIK